jgi:transposase, IS30 family
VERLTRGKNAEEVVKTVIKTAEALKKHITTDNGGEFAKHKLISKKLHTYVYFTAPYSSWQNRSVDNTNKLI